MTEVRVHKFEEAGLGKAPFRCVGVERRVGPIKYDSGGVTVEIGAPGQPMGVCDYCGTGIADCYIIVSADKRRFVVGSDCVYKTGDAGLKRSVDPEKRKVYRTKREVKARAVVDELDRLLGDPEVVSRLEAVPHPRGFVDRATGRPLTYSRQVPSKVSRRRALYAFP